MVIPPKFAYFLHLVSTKENIYLKSVSCFKCNFFYFFLKYEANKYENMNTLEQEEIMALQKTGIIALDSYIALSLLLVQSTLHSIFLAKKGTQQSIVK